MNMGSRLCQKRSANSKKKTHQIERALSNQCLQTKSCSRSLDEDEIIARLTYAFYSHSKLQLSLISDVCQLVQLTQRFAYPHSQHLTRPNQSWNLNLLTDSLPTELALDSMFDDRVIRYPRVH